MKKIALVLFNLGGPDSQENVEEFLFNLFSDKAIINLPNPLRWLIAKLISKRRAPIAKEIYAHLGGGSPILPETIEQKQALEKILNKSEYDWEVFISMRYFHPRSVEVVKNISKGNFDEVILLPLYPHFSISTTKSSIDDFMVEFAKKNLNLPIKSICCYPCEDKFIAAHTQLIKESYDKVKDLGRVRILFSAHGLPERIIKSGDPYQWQIEQTVKSIVNVLNIENLDYLITYQSKVGPIKWLTPATDEEIIKAANEKLAIVIVPIAFTSEHSETLVELDIEYKHLAEKAVCYERVKALSVNDFFIESLRDICLNMANQKTLETISYYSNELKRICPQEFCKCINNFEEIV